MATLVINTAAFDHPKAPYGHLELLSRDMSVGRPRFSGELLINITHVTDLCCGCLRLPVAAR